MGGGRGWQGEKEGRGDHPGIAIAFSYSRISAQRYLRVFSFFPRARTHPPANLVIPTEPGGIIHRDECLEIDALTCYRE